MDGSRSAQLARQRRSERGRRVLLAEDDHELRSLLAGALRRDGHGIAEVRDGFELVQRLTLSLKSGGPVLPFDVVISDVRMPGWSGLEVLAAMARHAHVPPFVLITGFGDEATYRHARELGAVAVMAKPFDVDDLRDLVTSLPSRTR